MNREENKKYFTLFLRLLVLVLGILVILLINYQIIQGWFGKNGPANLGSIEVSYVSMAKFIRDYGMSSWAPYWYLGFPFHLFYTPLMPFFEVFLHELVGLFRVVEVRIERSVLGDDGAHGPHARDHIDPARWPSRDGHGRDAGAL